MATHGSDWYLDWNSDFLLTPSGSIQTAVGWDRIRQRVIRRMITNRAQTLPSGRFTPSDYIFEPEFGDGLGAVIDEALSSQFYANLIRICTSAVLSDDDIDSAVPPNIQFFRPDVYTLWIVIGVTLITGQPGQVSVSYSTKPPPNVAPGLALVTEGGLAIVDENGNALTS